jgi:hypothetical protein
VQHSNEHQQHTNQNHKEKHQAQQFIVINIFVIGSCVFLILLNLCNVISDFSKHLYFIRQLFRIGNLICQSSIPIASLVYTPVYPKFKDFLAKQFSSLVNHDLPLALNQNKNQR